MSQKVSSHQDAVGLDGEALEIRVEKFPRIYNNDFSQRDPYGLEDKEHQA